MILPLIALAAASPSETDMAAQFRAGRMLCSNPDTQTKTCSTIDRLTVCADGVMINNGETLIAPDKPLTLEVASVAHFEDGAICGSIEMTDVKKGVVRLNGKPIPPDRNALVLEKLGEVFRSLAGQKVCEGLQEKDGKLIKVGQVERVDLPLPGKPVRWIRPEDGYRVAPRTP